MGKKKFTQLNARTFDELYNLLRFCRSRYIKTNKVDRGAKKNL
jgi:hypothetical protein